MTTTARKASSTTRAGTKPAKRSTTKAAPSKAAPAKASKPAAPAKPTVALIEGPAVAGLRAPGGVWREASTKAGMTEAQLAEAMGLSRKTLNRLFRGAHGMLPTARQVVAYAQAMGSSADKEWAQVAAYMLATAKQEAGSK